jgi:hypothetical protein
VHESEATWCQLAIVLKPFLDFMDSFKLSKAHNMLVLMLDPWFKDLSLVGDFVGHVSTIEIVATYDTQFLFPTLKTLYHKLHGWLNASSSVVHEIASLHINVVFGVAIFLEETFLEQVNVILIFVTHYEDN